MSINIVIHQASHISATADSSLEPPDGLSLPERIAWLQAQLDAARRGVWLRIVREMADGDGYVWSE